MFALNFPAQIPVGQVVITPAAAHRLSLGEVTAALRRHARGDQGDFRDVKANGRHPGRTSRLSSPLGLSGGQWHALLDHHRP